MQTEVTPAANGIDVRRAAAQDPRVEIQRYMRSASLEMTVHDIAQLAVCGPLLPPGTKLYVSHLPGQQFSDTVAACAAVNAAGLDAVPHVPARCIQDSAQLERFLADCVTQAKVQEVLLISGDYPQAAGPYSAVIQILQSNVLTNNGIRRVSVAGHPEGHPAVSLEDVQRAEQEKIVFAQANAMELTFVTQFFFDSQPFLEWRNRLRAAGFHGRVQAGLAGPAKMSTLFRYALKCGVGPSIRALGARPSSFAKLLGERGPEPLIRDLTRASAGSEREQTGLHLFSFGGLTRTCQWLAAVNEGRFELDEKQGFVVRT